MLIGGFLFKIFTEDFSKNMLLHDYLAVSIGQLVLGLIVSYFEIKACYSHKKINYKPVYIVRGGIGVMLLPLYYDHVKMTFMKERYILVLTCLGNIACLIYQDHQISEYRDSIKNGENEVEEEI